jgi:hypothetical protein
LSCSDDISQGRCLSRSIWQRRKRMEAAIREESVGVSQKEWRLIIAACLSCLGLHSIIEGHCSTVLDSGETSSHVTQCRLYCQSIERGRKRQLPTSKLQTERLRGNEKWISRTWKRLVLHWSVQYDRDHNWEQNFLFPGFSVD